MSVSFYSSPTNQLRGSPTLRLALTAVEEQGKSLGRGLYTRNSFLGGDRAAFYCHKAIFFSSGARVEDQDSTGP